MSDRQSPKSLSAPYHDVYKAVADKYNVERSDVKSLCFSAVYGFNPYKGTTEGPSLTEIIDGMVQQALYIGLIKVKSK